MDRELRQAVRERAGHACEYCCVPEAVNLLPFQADHIIAEKHDGPTELINLAWSCYDCNMYKGPNIAGVDKNSGEVIRLFNPRRDIWSSHFHWEGPRLIGESSIGTATVFVLRINRANRLAFRQSLIEEGVFPPAIND